MRFIVVDPGLIQLTGHHYNFDIALKQELDRRNIPLQVFAHRDADPMIVQELAAIPVLTDYPYTDASYDPHPMCQMLENFIYKGHQVTADLTRALPPAGLDRSDIVLFHTITQANMLGILYWLGQIPADRQPLVVIGFQLAINADFNSLEANVYRMGMKALRRRYPRLMFFCCSSELARMNGEIGSVEIATLPYPVAPAVIQPAAQRERTRLKVAYLGHAMETRGVSLLPQIVTESAQRGLAVDFVLQLSEPLDKVVVATAADPALQRENVRLIVTSLNQADYYACLEDADIVLLPYDSNFYRNAHSGVFTEAMWFGKAVVCPEGTWMARQLTKIEAGGASFDAFSATAITDALERVLLDWPQQHDRARRAASQWQEKNNSARFVDALLEFAARPTPSQNSRPEK